MKLVIYSEISNFAGYLGRDPQIWFFQCYKGSKKDLYGCGYDSPEEAEKIARQYVRVDQVVVETEPRGWF